MWAFPCYHMGMEAFYPDYQPISRSAEPLSDDITRVEGGYPFAVFDALAERLRVSQARLAAVLNISSSTLQRRRNGSFSVAESGRLYQLEALVTLAEKTVGDQGDAIRWLTTPNPNLGVTPLELTRTAPGLEAVTRYLEQVADGVYL